MDGYDDKASCQGERLTSGGGQAGRAGGPPGLLEGPCMGDMEGGLLRAERGTLLNGPQGTLEETEFSVSVWHVGRGVLGNNRCPCPE